jgi:hypothetical protein
MILNLAFKQGIRALSALALSAMCASMMLASMTNAAELVMFRRDGCPWCAKWDREIGPVYSKTELGRRAPLRVVNLDQGRDASVRVQRPIRYTPTFVLVENGEEHGRIEGYPGDVFFWVLLERLLEPLPAASPKGASTPAAIAGDAMEHLL